MSDGDPKKPEKPEEEKPGAPVEEPEEEEDEEKTAAFSDGPCVWTQFERSPEYWTRLQAMNAEFLAQFYEDVRSRR